MSYYYSYQVAKDLLSETEKTRLLCVLLHATENLQVDWEGATTDFGAASVNSMRVMYNGSFKKLTDAGGKIDKATGQPIGAADKNAKAPKPATPRKRKAANAENGENGEQKTPRKRMTKKQKEEKAKLEEEKAKLEAESAAAALAGRGADGNNEGYDPETGYPIDTEENGVEAE